MRFLAQFVTVFLDMQKVGFLFRLLKDIARDWIQRNIFFVTFVRRYLFINLDNEACAGYTLQCKYVHLLYVISNNLPFGMPVKLGTN